MKKYLIYFSITIFGFANAQYQLLTDFTTCCPYFPKSDLTFISIGPFLYGMTSKNGNSDNGTIFRIKPDGTQYLKLHDFGSGDDGRSPLGSLISDGTFLFGVTERGGIYDYGTIFRIKLDGTQYLKLHDCREVESYPIGSLISDGAFLYGMTTFGGTNDAGTIFKIKPDGTQYLKLHDFGIGDDGSYPRFGSLISDGAFLYGMTSNGGIYASGTVFKIRPDGIQYVKLHDFGSGDDGNYPYGSLNFDGTFLYGMTKSGGTNNDGTIFKIQQNGSGYVKLHDFKEVEDGGNPSGSLIFDGTFLYGMTYIGGTYSNGTIFNILPNGTGYLKLHDFRSGEDGNRPFGSLIFDGTFLYGMTSTGGTTNAGTIFKIKTNGTGYLKLYDFGSEEYGMHPSGSLIFDGTFLFGMTTEGGINNKGTIFKIKPDGTEYVKLHGFGSGEDGRLPLGSLISDGTFLFGMTTEGGIYDYGTIFKIRPDGTGYMKLHDFGSGKDGRTPFGSLISDGTFLYGLTFRAGIYDDGTIFKIGLDGTGYVKLRDFKSAEDGSLPTGSLIFDGTFLYGMTSKGGNTNDGTIFKILQNGAGYMKLHDFKRLEDGSNPRGSLISDGTFLYGMTSEGGNYYNGTIFKIMLDGTEYLKMHDFGNGDDGSYPYGSLISDGTFLYGMATGNLITKGNIFKIKLDGTEYFKLHDFGSSYPRGSLISDGTFLYGMTYEGGYNNNGTVFKYDIITSISDNKNGDHYSIYPNPNNGIFQLTSDNISLKNGEIEIYNMIGVKVLTQKILNEHTKIDLSTQSNGVYFFHLKTNASNNIRRIETNKIIINK